MTNLMNTIPAYKPLNTVRPALPQNGKEKGTNNQIPKHPQNATSSVSNPFPQIQTYEYLPARPLSPSRTAPKGVRPHPERGRLVKENIFQSMGSTVKSYADYMKYFYRAAFKGEGTDYSVGKINDLAIRTGSLGIAAVLAASKFFPAAKGMEFVGLGTWFASMAIWPQILGAPIKAKTGVDINQKYIDSYGRRKFVYEDNLYRPMDLYRFVNLNGKPMTPEEYHKKYDEEYVYLDAVGDKLGIPRDIKNRHEAIMNKMGQVAVQGKTLWMLTAGVMTPVISSIAADAAQGPLKSALESHRNKTAAKELEKLDSTLSELLDLKNGKDGGMGSGLVKNIDTIMRDLNISVPKDVEKEFNSLLLKDCELTKAEFDRLQAMADSSLGGTNLNQLLKEALNSSNSNGEKILLSREKMGSILNALYSNDVKNVSQPVKDELEYLLSRSQKLDKQEFEKLQKFIENRFFGTGFKDSLDNVIKYDVKYTEPHITLSDKLNEGLAKATSDAVKQAISKMKKPFADSLPDAVKNYEGISRQEYLDIIERSANNGAKEMNVFSHNSFENMAKRIAVKRFEQMGLDRVAVKMISESMDEHIKTFIQSQRHFIIPHQRLTQLFRFAELNTQLLQKIENFEKVSIMNISESMTANNWGKLPKKYLQALKFTKAELAQIAALDSTTASKVIMKKFEQIAADPLEYERVIKKMTVLAESAVTKEEQAVVKLIGTYNTRGTLSKVKDLMQEAAQANFGWNMKKPIERFYSNTIYEIQNKLRNTIDSLVRPIKGLDSFRFAEQKLRNSHFLGASAEEFGKLVYQKNQYGTAAFPDYHMFEGMEYEQAVEGMKTYIKDAVLDKNDINNWTTKFEHPIPGAKRGLKYSPTMVEGVANVLNGDFNSETQRVIHEAFVTISEEAAAKDPLMAKKRAAQQGLGSKFLTKCYANNEIMRARFLRLVNRLTLAYDNNKNNYMITDFPLKKFTKDLLNGNKNALDVLEILINERKTEFASDGKAAKQLQDILENMRKGNALNPEYVTNTIKAHLTFDTHNFAISNMSGKNITEFLKNAAEETRSRNKWTKLTYGLLIGTAAISAAAIAMIGRKNYFNKDIYEKKDAPQGAVRQ